MKSIVGYLVSESLQEMGYSAGTSALLSALATGTVTYAAGKYLFKNAAGEVVGEYGGEELSRILKDEIGHSPDVPKVKGSAAVDIGYMKNNADPMRDLFGSGRVANTEEWTSIIRDLEASGVEIRYREGSMAYAPGMTDGSPGQLVIDPDDSLSALKHEYQHFLDAQAEGFPSFIKQMYEDPKARVVKELRAYMVEIKEADRLGLKEVSEQLFENYRQEREWIINQYILLGGE